MEAVKKIPCSAIRFFLIVASTIGLQVRRTRFNNVAVEIGQLEGNHIGMGVVIFIIKPVLN